MNSEPKLLCTQHGIEKEFKKRHEEGALSQMQAAKKRSCGAREPLFIHRDAAAEVLFLVFIQNSRFIEFASSVSNLSRSRRPNPIYTYIHMYVRARGKKLREEAA
jgi:hypothetical protein